MGVIADAIDKAVAADQEDGLRYHLGASVLGKECARAVWYSYRWHHPVRHTGRMVRLFERGHLEEHRFIKYLKRIGAKVAEVDPRTGKQFRIHYHNKTMGGSADGVISLPPEYNREGNGLVEFKTHGDKSFKLLLKSDVRTSKPEHFIQMQIYMYLLNLPWALYLAVNKDTDELYDEFVRLIPPVAVQYLNRGREIVDSTVPPPRRSEDPEFWLCRFCDYKRICHENAVASQNCRTCTRCELILDGDDHTWFCHTHNGDIPKEFTKRGCDDWTDVI